MKVAGDDARTCEHIAGEYRSNTEVAAAKIGRNEINDVKDFWLVVFVWPGAGDYQNADGVEGNALLDRNIYLRDLAITKGCSGVEYWPIQPGRYT
jgi:hypothetical protein